VVIVEDIIWRGTIQGEPASKANSRRVVTRKRSLTSMGQVVKRRRLAIIKSEKALAYVDAARWQLPVFDPLFQENVTAYLDIYYASHRPDLDESLVLDVLQDRIIKNDRQVRLKIVSWHLDKDNPRTVIALTPWVEEWVAEPSRFIMPDRAA
jgi:hypothetical protein